MKKALTTFLIAISVIVLIIYISYYELLNPMIKDAWKYYFTKGSPLMEISMHYNTCIYSGGVDEASTEEIGEFLGTTTYSIDHHNTTKWQEAGYSHDKTYNVYRLSGHEDLLTLIVETHKGKYVKLYSNGMVQPEYNIGKFSYVVDLYNLNQDTISNITAKSLNGTTSTSFQLNETETACLIDILLKEHDFVTIYDMSEPDITLDITMKNDASFTVYLILNNRYGLVHGECEYYLSMEDATFLKETLPDVLFETISETLP